MSASRRYGVICLVLATMLWCFTSVIVKYLSGQDLDPDVQHLFRYIAATVGLWPVVLYTFGRETFAAMRKWWVFLGAAAANCLFQVCMVRAKLRAWIRCTAWSGDEPQPKFPMDSAIAPIRASMAQRVWTCSLKRLSPQ